MIITFTVSKSTDYLHPAYIIPILNNYLYESLGNNNKNICREKSYIKKTLKN